MSSFCTANTFESDFTSTAEEAKEYFADLDTHVIPFNKLSLDNGDASDLDEDVDEVIPDVTASGSDLIDMVFRKDRVEDRKNWLNSFEENTYLDYSRAQSKGVHYSEFVNREMILFSNADNKRSIACFVDGFKPSQRKILFACFKKNLKKEMKVAQLAGYVGEHAAFHHGGKCCNVGNLYQLNLVPLVPHQFTTQNHVPRGISSWDHHG